VYVGVIHNIIMSSNIMLGCYVFTYSRDDGTSRYSIARMNFDSCEKMLFHEIGRSFSIDLGPFLSHIKYDP
jgi:hypothetical protein